MKVGSISLSRYLPFNSTERQQKCEMIHGMEPLLSLPDLYYVWIDFFFFFVIKVWTAML